MESSFRGKKAMKKKLIAVLTALLLISTQELVVFAAPATIQESRQEYNQAAAEVAELQEQVYALDDEIGGLNAAIESNNTTIASAKQQMEEKKAEIARLAEEIAPKKEIYEAKVRAMYKNGRTSILEVLLQTESFGDLISTFNSVIRILSIDNEIITEYNEAKANIESLLTELETEAQELEALNQENHQLTAELEAKRQSQNTLLAEAKAKLDQIEGDLEDREYNTVKYYIDLINSSSSVSDIKTAVDSLRGLRAGIVTKAVENKVVAAIELGTSKVNSAISGTTSSSSAASLISYAYKFLGTPYVWGGTTPSGFDCSGFTQYVFRKFGYSIGRTTYDQIKAGRPVSRSEMKPGDLIFTHAGHVGIYLGNNQFIHAPQTGDVIKVSTVTKFYAARRVL